MRQALAVLSILISLILYGLYWFRPNWAASVTIFPAWSWLLIWSFAIPAYRHKVFKISCILWILFTLTFVEEIRSLAKSFIPPERPEAVFMVITVNCSGSMDPLLSALDLDPAVILIQETPQQSTVEEWIRKNPSYDYAHGIDTSILVKGTITNIGPKAFFYNSVKAQIREQHYQITSLRLATSNPRIDL